MIVVMAKVFIIDLVLLWHHAHRSSSTSRTMNNCWAMWRHLVVLSVLLDLSTLAQHATLGR